MHAVFNRNLSPQETFSISDKLCGSFISHLVNECIVHKISIRSISHGLVHKIDPIGNYLSVLR